MLLKSQNFQRLHRWHRWLGLLLSLHILVLAITGVVLVFRHEIEPSAPLPPLSTEPVSLQSLVEKSLQRHPNDRVLAIVVDHDDPQKVTLRLGPDGSPKFRGARRLHADQRDGEFVAPTSSETGWMQTILVLHRELFLGTYGKLYVGLLGLAYALLLISGMILYGPLMKRLRFGSVRTHRPRIFWADLHKYFGAVTFGWSLVIGLSGFLLGWGGPIIKFYQAYALQDLTAEFSGPQKNAAIVPVDNALAAAMSAKPDGHFSFVAFPGSEFSTAHHYIFVIDGATPLTQKLSDLVVVNAYDGRLERVLIQPWYLRLLLLAEPLHFGDYGGLTMKILWVIFGLFSMILPGTGLWIFLQKYRKAKQERRQTAVTKDDSGTHRAYPLPLMLMALSWIGLMLALFVDGGGDTLANVFLALVLLLALGTFWRNKRAARSVP